MEAAGIHGHLTVPHSSIGLCSTTYTWESQHKRSCASEDEEEDTTIDMSYRCKLFVGDPPRLVVIGRVYATSSTIHTLPLGDDFAKVVVEEVRHADAEVPCPHQRLDLWERHLVHLLRGLHISYRPFLEGLRYIVIISLNII